MKKILVYGLSSMYGGVEAFILNYVNYLPEDKYNVELVVMNKEPEYLKERLQRKVTVHVVPERIKNPVGYSGKANQIIRNGKYDILWCNFCTLTDITWLKAGTRYKIPVRIAHSHNSENMGGKVVMLTHLQHKRVIQKYASHFFACSDIAGEFMFGKKILRENNYHMIYNAIETEKYAFCKKVRDKVRTTLGLEGKQVIGNVGRFHFQKNHSFIIELFNQFHKIHPSSVLMLVGNGELLEEVKTQVQSLGISDSVLFMGSRRDVNELVQGMDLLLMPSKFEGLPVSAIEAQAAGLPCLFSDAVTDQVKIAEAVKFESLDAPAEKWIEDMEALLQTPRENTSQMVVAAGYDIKENAGHIFERCV
ncbi:glycosyltransferase family 1 protein [Ruminococcus sp. 5_1_39BFAA]|uniref:glycosyltransferase family 1 protein n=1 Tax=Ruminococcus sp. 5_1_39BFAA TaxID=457412 RepID=UPI003562AD16